MSVTRTYLEMYEINVEQISFKQRVNVIYSAKKVDKINQSKKHNED